ncbi:translation initiation factor SUI1-related protein [Porphyromonas crevioricanis JCM 15906]|uniref:Translation initiation factor SUI1-related protein n=1 Tax=Porphyromonas crevioricanis JCM 15906 TaxID=1305617 RepID=S4NFL3_9PORP|nr:translation initiation factor [Porphyromonas crevioricanis]GAD04347.1 translation initiation factor SUI1-related protein [Porphyromonas crevioricanis JCM 15906]SJZ87796.1 translation initiation factor 1 (eIF-1/SUI1) [Porphyromonas crevioricanis]
MSKKNRRDRLGVVYSTADNYGYCYEEEEILDTLPADEQKLRVSLDKKQRKGKEVTLVSGFVGTDDDLQELGRKLRQSCGVGGSAKDGQILVQGDQRQKVADLLSRLGYKLVKVI